MRSICITRAPNRKILEKHRQRRSMKGFKKKYFHGSKTYRVH